MYEREAEQQAQAALRHALEHLQMAAKLAPLAGWRFSAQVREKLADAQAAVSFIVQRVQA